MILSSKLPKTKTKLLNNSFSQPNFRFKYGRVDCPTSPSGSKVGLPEGFWNYTEVTEFYKNFFKMNEREAVVITGGGHALGGAFSVGWSGLWQQSEFN